MAALSRDVPLTLVLSLTGFCNFARHYFRNLGWFLFLELLRCFSSPGSPRIPMYSVCDTLKGALPHSDILGSKLICQLPEAFRRLSRPSSPIIAKASTICSYSLDPITLISTLASKHATLYFKECLIGLSPIALSPYYLTTLSSFEDEIFVFDAIKKLLLLLLVL